MRSVSATTAVSSKISRTRPGAGCSPGFQHAGDQGPPTVVGSLAQQDVAVVIDHHSPHCRNPQGVVADFFPEFEDEFGC